MVECALTSSVTWSRMAFVAPAEEGPGLSLTTVRRSDQMILLGAFGATHSKSKNLIQDPKQRSSYVEMALRKLTKNIAKPCMQ